MRRRIRKGWVSVRCGVSRARQASIEMFVAFLCIISGLPILLNPGAFAPGSVLVSLPLVFVVVWGLVLFLGGVLTVVGILAANAYLNRAGLILLAAASIVMGISIYVIAGVTRIFTVGTYVVFSLAMFGRYRELGRALKERRDLWKEIKRLKNGAG